MCEAKNTGHHGWQPALMMGLMWMANVVGEFLARVNEGVQVNPLRAPMQIIDDPVSMLEQAAGDLRAAYRAKDIFSVLKQLGLLLYYTLMLMATSMQLHPYLSSTYMCIREWQLSKIYQDLGQAESAYDMIQNSTTVTRRYSRRPGRHGFDDPS